jgi:hypothetical protein
LTLSGEPACGGPGCRFHRLPLLLTGIVVRIVHFIMQRKQLLGIAERVEAQDDRSPFTGPTTISSRTRACRSSTAFRYPLVRFAISVIVLPSAVT